MRRATSDLYYVLFHRICETLVEPLGQDVENPAFRETYLTLYRLPDHGFIEKRCSEVLKQGFDDRIKDFARQLISLKNKRHRADYDPLSKWSISEVENDLEAVTKIMSDYEMTDPAERVRFAYFISIKSNRKTD